jgi:hypothetical protein
MSSNISSAFLPAKSIMTSLPPGWSSRYLKSAHRKKKRRIHVGNVKGSVEVRMQKEESHPSSFDDKVTCVKANYLQEQTFHCGRYPERISTNRAKPYRASPNS